jgi:hypothetical protein
MGRGNSREGGGHVTSRGAASWFVVRAQIQFGCRFRARARIAASRADAGRARQAAVRALCAGHADVERADADGQSPLLLAAQHGCPPPPPPPARPAAPAEARLR